MSNRTWASADARFVVVLSRRAHEAIERTVELAGSIETGGVLIGAYDADHRVATVDEATGPPADSSAGPKWFRRGTRKLADLLLRRWQATRKTYYLGDWHYHPADVVEPSEDDFAQVTSIAGDENYRCPEVVMLIVGRRRDGARMRPARVFVAVGAADPLELREPEVDAQR